MNRWRKERIYVYDKIICMIVNITNVCACVGGQ